MCIRVSQIRGFVFLLPIAVARWDLAVASKAAKSKALFSEDEPQVCSSNVVLFTLVPALTEYHSQRSSIPKVTKMTKIKIGHY